MDKQKENKKEENAFTQLSNILFDTKQTQQKFLELTITTPKHAINKELGSGNMSYFKGLYAMKLAVIMNTHQLYQRNKRIIPVLTSSDIEKKKSNEISKKKEENELKIIEQFIDNIGLNSMLIDPNKLTINNFENDLSNAIDMSFKNPSCFKLLLWINKLLQINSKHNNICIPLQNNLLSFLQELSPFKTLNVPCDKFIADEFTIDEWDNININKNNICDLLDHSEEEYEDDNSDDESDIEIEEYNIDLQIESPPINTNGILREHGFELIVPIKPKNWGPFHMLIKKEGIEMHAPCGYPTVIGNYKLTHGKWYYEVQLLTPRCGQFGWGTHQQGNDSDGGLGTGDDSKGWAYDGYRKKKWNGKDIDYGKKWNQNDIIGFTIDLDNKIMNFYLNGDDMGIAYKNFNIYDGIAPSLTIQSGGKFVYISNAKYFKQKIPNGYKPLPLQYINTKFTIKSIKKCQYVSDFDTNGVLYYLGTDLGTQQYINPGLNINGRDKKIDIYSTTLNSDSSPIYSFIGRDKVRCLTQNKRPSAFWFHIKKYGVKVNKYTLRHYKSQATHHMKTWLFQASNNGYNWITLSEHINDMNLKGINKTYTYSIINNNL